MGRHLQRNDLPALSQLRAKRSLPAGLIAAVWHGPRTALWFLGLLALVTVLTAGVIATSVVQQVSSRIEEMFAMAVRRWRTDSRWP
ncbi:MAG TPA: hypothetical protein VFS23_30295 [Vicinamibacterales bacterium]|nr:hypothetical protein [Vicinamibacterales bacterium]